MTETPDERDSLLAARLSAAENAYKREQLLRIALTTRVGELTEERDRLQDRLNQIEEGTL